MNERRMKDPRSDDTMKKSHWPIPEKKAKQGVEDILFWKTPWNFSFFYFTLQILHKTKPNPLDITKLC